METVSEGGFMTALESKRTLHVKTGIHDGMTKIFVTPFADTTLIAACHSDELPPRDYSIRSSRLYILELLHDGSIPQVLAEIVLPPTYVCICGGRVYAVLPRLSRAQQPASMRAPTVQLCIIVTLCDGSALTLISDACEMRRQLDGNSAAIVDGHSLRGHDLDAVVRATTMAAFECITAMRMGVAPAVDQLACGFAPDVPSPSPRVHPAPVASGTKRRATTAAEDGSTARVRVKSRKQARDAAPLPLEFAPSAVASESSTSTVTTHTYNVRSAGMVDEALEEALFGSSGAAGAPSARRGKRTAVRATAPAPAAASDCKPTYSSTLLSPLWTQPPRAILLEDEDDGEVPQEADAHINSGVTASEVQLLLRDTLRHGANGSAQAPDNCSDVTAPPRLSVTGLAATLARDSSVWSTLDALVALTGAEVVASQEVELTQLTQLLEAQDENVQVGQLVAARAATPITATMISSIWEQVVVDHPR